MKKAIPKEFIGEFIGTFIIVFLGCGSVAVSTLFGSHQGLFQVAAVWGIAVTLAIYVSRALSCAHLNPAVSIAFVVAKRLNPDKLLVYLLGQLSGAFFAAVVLYGIFSGSIANFEFANSIVRGSPESVRTAMMFGEYFPNPLSSAAMAGVSNFNAFLAETVGTFLLVFFIFMLTEGCNIGRPALGIAPIFIGVAVTVIISVIAPLTQACLNPARDFGPRLFSFIAGWGDIAIPGPRGGFFSVYILGPIVGGILASIVFTKTIERLMKDKHKKGGECGCEKD